MGGSKQRSVGSSDKVNGNTQGGHKNGSKKEESKKIGSKQQQQRQKLSVLVEESQGLKVLQSMKAITIQSFARSTGVKISAANSFIKSAEARGIIRNVGGYSGHRVYQVVK